MRDEEPNPLSPPTRMNLLQWVGPDSLQIFSEEHPRRRLLVLSGVRRSSRVAVKQYFFNLLMKGECQMTAFLLNFAIQQQQRQQQRRPQE